MTDELNWPKVVPELTTLDFAKSLSFYVEVLGFHIENQRENPDFAYLTLGDAHLMIEAWHDQGWNTAEPLFPLGVGMNLQIECDHVEPLKDKLTEKGIALFRPIKETWYNTGQELCGYKEFLVQDPSGYLLRFSEYLGERPIPLEVQHD